jgi:hypothetical protein
VLACLSRRRSWVQIPSGTLDSTVRKLEKRRSSNLRDFVGSTPTRATDWVVFLVAACKTVVTKQARWTTRGSIPSRPTDRWPVRLTAGCETLILATRVRSPHGSLTTAKWWNWDTRDAQNVVPQGDESSNLSLATDKRSRVSQRSAGPHKPGPSGATPEPAT